MPKLELKRATDWRERVQHLSSLILALPAHRPVADVLDRRPVQMIPADYAFVIKRLGSLDWRRALETYEWLNLRRRSSPDPRMLASIISILGRASQDPIALDLFSRAPPDVPTQVYNAVMGVHARRGRYDEVRELLDLMHARGCEPDLITFNTMINARAKAGRIALGDPSCILAELRSAGLHPDAVTYNTLITACPSPADASLVLADMRTARCCPDLWTYNALVSLHGRRGTAAGAQLMVAEMRADGFRPDAVTYNALLHAYAREGKGDEAERVCREMRAAGLTLDEITYNTLIHMYGRRGIVEAALRFYSEMRGAGCRPDVVTYTVLIDCLGKAGRVSDATRAMSEMVDLGLRPTLMTYSALICAYAKVGMCEVAENMFDNMVRSGVKPDHLLYSVTINFMLRSGNTRKAMQLYRAMVRDGCKPEGGLYLGMLAAFAKERRDEDVEELVRDMRELCGMNWSSVSSLLVRAECFDRGASTMKDAVLLGEEVEHEVLSSILNEYATANKEEEARALLDFLREHAPNCQELVSEASILMHCRNKQVGAALEEYNKLTGFGSNFGNRRPESVEPLIACCEEHRLFAEACRAFSDMRFHCIKPSLATYKSMMNIYCRMGFPETADYLLDQAMGAGIASHDISHHVTLIVEMYGKLKVLKRAEDLVARLRFQGLAGRKIWNSLIYAYAENGLYEQARAVFNIMMKDGLSPSVDSVNGLMQALIMGGRLDEIYVVIKELQDLDFRVSKSTTLLMLDAFARAGNIFEVKKIYNGMKEAGYFPSMHLYRDMINLFCRGRRVGDVEAMLLEMEGSSFKPDLAIYNSLLRMYVKIKDFRKAAIVHEKIQQAEFEKDEETYNLLILMYSKDRRPVEGLSLLCQMKRLGMEPKLQTYKSLITSCGREKLWEEAEDLFLTTQQTYKLDLSVYHVMLKMYRDSGNRSKAEHLLSQMKGAGVEPTVVTLHMLMDTHGSSGQPQEAENLLNSLKTSSLDLSTLPYSSVIDAYLRSSNYSMAIKTVIDMKNDGVQPDHRIWTCFIRGASICSETSVALYLLDSLKDAGFDLPIRLLKEKSEILVKELDILLDKIGIEDNASLNFINALEDLLWAFECRATASWIFQLALSKGIYHGDVFRVVDKDWRADFRKLSAGAAFVGLTLWLDHMQDASLQGFPEPPKSVVLITGVAEYHMVSLNKSIKVFLWEMGSPFLPCKTRIGVLVAKAHSLRMWLKESSFCMDLELRDAPSLPKTNSIYLMEGHFMRAGLVPAFKDIHERLGQVSAKKFSRLALMTDERRDKAITTDIKGREEKLEKMKKKGVFPQVRRPTRLRIAKKMRTHKYHMSQTQS